MLNPVEVKVIKAIIVRFLSKGYSEVNELIKNTSIPYNVLVNTLRKFEELNLIKIVNKRLEPINLWELLVWSIANNVYDPEYLLGYVDWRMFEMFVCEVLKRMGYNVTRGFRFKHAGRLFEVDIIASHNSRVLAIDCKHWSRSRISQLRNAITKHLERVKMFSKISSIKLGLQGTIYPVIVVWKDIPLRIIDGVAIVSIFRFRDFIVNIWNYQNLLVSFKSVKRGLFM